MRQTFNTFGTSQFGCKAMLNRLSSAALWPACLRSLTIVFRTSLRWMMQKDALCQDMFLVGPPGADRLRIALLFCEILVRAPESRSDLFHVVS